MLAKERNRNQLTFYSTFEECLDSKHSLYILANKIDWQTLEDDFSKHYCHEKGRPAKSIRLMCGLLILKHVRNISDESVVEQFAENSYYQYFCGYQEFTTGAPCNSSELVHFRNRIGEAGVELILKESIRVTSEVVGCDNSTAFIDSTVQEKNITFPTDTKLHKKIIEKCQKITEKHSLTVRQSYKFKLKDWYRDQRFRNHAKNRQKAIKADGKIKTITGRLVRELKRNLESIGVTTYDEQIKLFLKILAQKKDSKNKIYSIHEPEIKCLSKGKQHKKYEFGNKVSIIISSDGAILGALSFRNEYDGHTIEKSLEQVTRLTGNAPKILAGDRGYRGLKQYEQTEIVIPSNPLKRDSDYQKRKKRKLFCSRAAIEPVIGHLKSDHRLNRNFYKGLQGDAINVMLAAAAFNFKRVMNFLFGYIFKTIFNLIFPKKNSLSLEIINIA